MVFETDVDAQILPVNMPASVFIAGGTYRDVSPAFTARPAEGSILTVPAAQSVQLCFGFDQATVAEILLDVELTKPINLDPITANPQASVAWVFSSALLDPGAWTAIPAVNVVDETNGLQRDELVG